TFGFSLYRGTPGVPPRQRAASVGRAVAFNVGDAIVEQLRRAGYDAVLSDGTTPEPDGRALIVTGAFRNINEGQRRRVGAENPSVSAYGEVDYRAGPGAALQRISNFALDSRQVAGSGGDVKPRRCVSGTRSRQHFVELVDDHLGELPAGMAAIDKRRQIVDLDGIGHRQDRPSTAAQPDRLIVKSPIHDVAVAGFLQQIRRRAALGQPGAEP